MIICKLAWNRFHYTFTIKFAVLFWQQNYTHLETYLCVIYLNVSRKYSFENFWKWIKRKALEWNQPTFKRLLHCLLWLRWGHGFNSIYTNKCEQYSLLIHLPIMHKFEPYVTIWQTSLLQLKTFHYSLLMSILCSLNINKASKLRL